jgi:uncharacterized protein
MNKIDNFRTRKNTLFAGGEQSPLSPEQQHHFEGLRYFPENPALALTLDMDRSKGGTSLTLETSDGQTREYRRVGTVDVPIGNETATLTLLAMPGHARLFLPFMDGTTGNESYKIGRYLEPGERPDGRIDVDFNYAYNPYCAYGEGWSCPIPPEENRITQRIEAGEQDFKG